MLPRQPLTPSISPSTEITSHRTNQPCSHIKLFPAELLAEVFKCLPFEGFVPISLTCKSWHTLVMSKNVFGNLAKQICHINDEAAIPKDLSTLKESVLAISLRYKVVDETHAAYMNGTLLNELVGIIAQKIEKAIASQDRNAPLGVYLDLHNHTNIPNDQTSWASHVNSINSLAIPPLQLILRIKFPTTTISLLAVENYKDENKFTNLSHRIYIYIKCLKVIHIAESSAAFPPHNLSP